MKSKSLLRHSIENTGNLDGLPSESPSQSPIYPIGQALSKTQNIGYYLKPDKPTYPYESARYVNASGKKYIEFKIWNQDKDKLDRIRDYRINSFVGSPGFKLYKEKFIKEINDLLSAGAFISEKQQTPIVAPEPAMSVKEAFNHAVKIKEKSVRDRSSEAYAYSRNLFFEFLKKKYPALLNQPISNLTRKHCIEYFEYLKIEAIPPKRPNQVGYGNYTVNNQKTYLITLLNDLVDSEKLQASPMDEKKRNKKSRLLPVDEMKNVAFNDDQVKKIKAVLDASTNYCQLGYFFHWIYYTFARPTELRKLKIKHLNLNQLTGHVPSDISKNRISRNFEILPPLKEIIQEMKLSEYDPEFYIFGTKGEPGPKRCPKNKFTKPFRDILTGLSIGKDYTLYSTKHYGVTKHFLAGYDLRWLQDQAGFKRLETLLKYLRSLGVSINRKSTAIPPSL